LIEPSHETFRVLEPLKPRHSSVFLHADRSGLKPESAVRAVELESASPELAAILDIEVGHQVYRYVRTRYVAERALANQTNFIPSEVCPGLEYDDVSRHSFQQLLEVKYRAVIADMEEDYSLVAASTEDREVLSLEHGSRVLLIRRLAKSATGWPLVWALVRVRPDRYRYVAELWPQAARLLEPGREGDRK
jgi:GntR family transcriptional regulator